MADIRRETQDGVSAIPFSLKQAALLYACFFFFLPPSLFLGTLTSQYSNKAAKTLKMMYANRMLPKGVSIFDVNQLG